VRTEGDEGVLMVRLDFRDHFLLGLFISGDNDSREPGGGSGKISNARGDVTTSGLQQDRDVPSESNFLLVCLLRARQMSDTGADGSVRPSPHSTNKLI
jgi:hypothetical protein